MKALTIWQPYLAGVLHGDGWCTRLAIGLRVKDHDFSELFCEGLNTLFGTAYAPKKDERGYWLVRSGNKTGRFDRLKTYEPTDNDELGCWLRGLFDSEGNAQLWLDHKKGPNSYHRRIAMYSTDLDTLHRAAEFLEWLDVSHSIRPTKNSETHKGSKTVFELRIIRRDGFTRFAEMVGSSIGRKQETIERMVNSYAPPGAHAAAQLKGVQARLARVARGGTY